MVNFPAKITLLKIFFEIIMQNYALCIFYFLWNIMGFLRPK